MFAPFGVALRRAASVACRFGGSRVFSGQPAVDVRNWKNPAAVMFGVHDLRFVDWPLDPHPPPGHVRVEIENCGICGSDVHFLQEGAIGEFVVREPMVIGHEAAGRVVDVAPDVHELQCGDAVAIEPAVPCWKSCEARAGRYNLDPGIKCAATPPTHGTLVQFVDQPVDFCHKLPPGLGCEEGAMAEPLSVALHAVRRAGVSPGKSVAVMGAGPIGLVTMMVAKAFGADCVAITDLNASNLDLAEVLGADITYRVRPGATPRDVAEQLREMVAKRGLDIVLDCAGFQDTMQTAMYAAARGGRVVLVGLGQQHVQFDLHPAVLREVDLLGSFRYANTWPLALRLLADKRVNVKPLITHRFGFSAEEVLRAFDTAANAAETGAIKVMFDLT